MSSASWTVSITPIGVPTSVFAIVKAASFDQSTLGAAAREFDASEVAADYSDS
jgi:hypothetical protein